MTKTEQMRLLEQEIELCKAVTTIVASMQTIELSAALNIAREIAAQSERLNQKLNHIRSIADQ